MNRLDQYFGVHGKALALRSQRMQVLASNIANAATPGFKARDVDFQSLMATGGTASGALRTTNARHMDGSTAASGSRDGLLYRQPLQPSLDGNTVELATEQLQFAETAVRYRSTLSLLGTRMSELSAAMKGD